MGTRLNVLVVADVLKAVRTGVEHYTEQLVLAIARHGDVQVSVLVNDESLAATFPESVRTIVRRTSPWAAILPFGGLERVFLDSFDVVHTPTPRVAFSARPRTAALVMTVHDLIPLIRPSHHPWAYRVYFRYALPRIIRRFDGIIAVSESTRGDLNSCYELDASAVDVVPEASRWPLARWAALEGEKKDYFVAIGTLEPRKNLARVIEAWSDLRRRQPDFGHRLVVAGRTGWGVDLPRSDDPLLEFRGYVGDEELKTLIEEATALVYPSLYEGFGLPVLEAMTLGCPVITARNSAIPEVGADAVLYVDPLDPASIANGMARLADDAALRRDLASRGLTQAMKFSWDRVAEETVDVYRRTIAKLRNR